MHVGVIVSRFEGEGAALAEKPFGPSHGNDTNWKQITSTSGPSGLVQSRQPAAEMCISVCDEKADVLQRRGVIDLFIQSFHMVRSAANCEVPSSV